MNPYAANFQVPVVPTATTTGPTAVVSPGLDGEANDHGQEAAWAEDPGQNADGAGGYWDEHGQHHPGYGGEYDPAVYHPDGYEPAYQQNGVLVSGGAAAPGGAADGWGEHRRVYEERASVTAVEFDPLEELLWAGHSDGRLTSYSQPDMAKHSSVAAHRHGNLRGQPAGPDGSILALAAFQQGVLSLSSSAVRLHSRGCLLRATFSGVAEIPGVRGIPPTQHHAENMTCCALNSPSTLMGMGTDSSSRVTVGTSGGGSVVGGTEGGSPPSLLQLDPVSGLRLVKAVGLPREAGVTSMARGAMLAVGCDDGRIRLLDPRLRSGSVEHVLKAHTGPVQAVAVTPTDGVKIVSVGMTSKSLNPYDTSAPTELFGDPVVRVFDARMPGRPGPPLQFSMLGAPRMVRFLADESLALATSSGQFLLSKEPFTDTPSLEFFHVTDEQGSGEALTCLAVASSGDGIALGSASGACIQMGNGDKDIRANLSSRPVEGPERPAPPAKVYVHPCDDHAPPASKYVMRQTPKEAQLTGALSSSFTTTPKIMRAVLRRPPPRRPATELLEKATWRDYLGVIPNPGHTPNSLLFGKGKAVYEVVDPRRRKDKDTPVFDRRNRSDSLGGSVAALQAMGLADVPRRYRRPALNLGRRGFDGFDFSRYNATEFAGLENAHAHSYVNSILQVLFFVPEVREAALREQYNPLHYSPLSGRTTSGLACELGFLFHQLEGAAQMEPKHRSCQASNFLRAFKEVPEVLALGLLEDPQSKRAIGLPRRVEALHRFLLSQLDKEAKEPALPPVPAPPAPTPPTSKAAAGGSRKKEPKSKKGKAAAAAAAALEAAKAEKEAAAAAAAAAAVAAAAERKRKADKEKGGGGGGGGGQKAGSTVDRLYGYGTRTSNAFLNDKRTTIDVKHTRTLVTEMIPVDHPGHASPAKYFADVLARSLCRETRARAWCDETSAYAPIKQKRCPVSLPEVMPIHCAAALESSEATKAAFGGKNSRGGPWLPQEIEISLLEREDGELSVVVGEAADRPASWVQALEAEGNAKKTAAAAAAAATATATAGDKRAASSSSSSSPEGKKGEAGGGSKASSNKQNHREGWYFASPLTGNAASEAVAAAAAAAAATAGTAAPAVPAPAAEQKGVGSQEERWLVDAVTRHRYELISVVSRVVPVVAEDKKKKKKAAGVVATAAAGAEGSAGAAAGEAEEPTEEGHLVLHVRAPAAAKPPARNAAAAAAAAAGGPSSSSKTSPTPPRPAAPGGKARGKGSKGGEGKRQGAQGPGGTPEKGGGAGGDGGPGAVDLRDMMEAGEGDRAEGGADAEDRRKGMAKNEGKEGGDEEDEEEWLMFNDFLVEKTVLDDARGFGPDWKEPCVLVYRRVASPLEEEARAAEEQARRAVMSRKRLFITPSVFDIAPVSKNRPVSQVVRLPPDRLPGKGDIVAIDAEFVSLTVEESRLRGDGSKVVTKQGRQSLARVSALDGRHSGSESNAIVMMDDYVVQSEPVVDHLTRFSGIRPEDLDPVTSRRNLHHMRTVYLRLRWLADAGCVFLGHGLDNDFRMCNLTLPPSQVIDTVHLWSLPGQRKISLRFLAQYLLNINIQGETHDSIEDARIALALYNKA
eukprot:g3971.t1